MINRRNLLLGVGATLLLPTTSSYAAGRTFLNGELNAARRTFDWTGGGNLPLQQSWKSDNFRKALAMSRLNLSRADQRNLHKVISTMQPDRFDLLSIEGQESGDVMISGNGVLALRPRVVTRKWKRGRTTMASWWSWTNPQTDEHWDITVPDVCKNLTIRRWGNPVPCICDPAKDAFFVS